MYSFRQLFRQKAKTISGVLLVAMAVAVLCVSLGQALATAETDKSLDYGFTTVALLAPRVYQEEFTRPNGTTIIRDTTKLSPEIADWLEQLTADRPDLVQTIAQHGLASAYIPELTADNYTQHEYRGYAQNTSMCAAQNFLPKIDGAPYSAAILELQLTSVSQPKENMGNYGCTVDGVYAFKQALKSVDVQLEGTVLSAVGLQEGFADPTGYTARITLQLPSMDDYHALNLTIGQRYVVFGFDYYDTNWRVCSELRLSQIRADQLTPSEDPDFVGLYCGVPLKERDLRMANSITMTVVDKAALPQNDYHQRPNGDWDLFGLLETMDILVDGETKTISVEEYRQRYKVPTIAHLTGSVEDFLQENALWAYGMELVRINSQSFPIIGVDKLDYVANFAQEITRITQGRDFTQEELQTGARVCVISETFAQMCGLEVGDSLHPQFYDYDYSFPYQTFLTKNVGGIEPTAMFYSSTTPFVGGNEEYIIVGLYRQDTEWGYLQENAFSFTPNTVFVPKASVPSTMEHAQQGVLQTIILQNGTIDEFEALAQEAGHEELFVYYDQHYSQIRESITDYEILAQRIVLIGTVVYGIILGLFLLLYPGRQGKALRTMANFGAPRKDKIAHVLLSALGILLPGTVLGAALGATLWGVVIGRLLTVSSALFSLTLDFGTLALISLAQLALAMLLVALLAIPMTRHCNLMKRK